MLLRFRNIFFLFALLSVSQHVLAQEAIFSTHFSEYPNIATVKGITGEKALDYTENNPERLVMKFSLSKKVAKSITISMWVRSSLKSTMEYVIVSSLKKRKDGYDGWKIGVQPSGAWQFSVNQGKNSYKYTPTTKQTIRNGKWHLLTISYDAPSKDLAFYYDGQKKAIYNAWGLEDAFSMDSLMIGNSLDNPHLYHTYGTTTDSTEWDTFYGQINNVKIYDYARSTEEISDYYTSVTGEKIKKPFYNGNKQTLKVMQFNIYHGAHETGKEVGLNRLIKILKEDNADIYTLTETYGSGEQIADALGYNFYLISTNLSIMSRYPIVKTYNIYHPFKSGGVQLQMPDRSKLNVFNLWLNYLPSKSGLAQHTWPSIDDFLKEEDATRGKDIRSIMHDIDSISETMPGVPIIVAGDFNSGSHLDWIKETEKNHFGYQIPWPASVRMYKSGFKDAYRSIYPDPLGYPGITWSTIDHGSPQNYVYDRIDYIYYKSKLLVPINAYLTGQSVVEFLPDHSIGKRSKKMQMLDVEMVKFPSDHLALTVLFKWKNNIPETVTEN